MDVRPVPLLFRDTARSLVAVGVAACGPPQGRARAGEAVCSPPRAGRASSSSGGRIDIVADAQMQVALDLEQFDRAARMTRQEVRLPTPAGFPIEYQAAACSAPVSHALQQAHKRADEAEHAATEVIKRARETAVHAVAASQIDANARVQQAASQVQHANEQARQATIQA